MAAFLKLGDIKGESSDQDHKDWILLSAMSSSIHRSLPAGSKDQQRVRGETTLGDIVLNRPLDKSSTKIAEACAQGKFFPDVQIDLCTTVNKKQQPVLTCKLKNVIISGYTFQGTATMDPTPSEEITLAFTDIEWNYTVLDPTTGLVKGNVPAVYNPGKGS